MELTCHILAGAIITLASVLGTALTLATLPGTWLMLVVALLVQWWRPGTFDWWTIGAAGILAVLAEVAEFVAGGAGAAKAGGSKRSFWLSLGGGLVGAIAGQVLIPIPIVGMIVGGIAGAAAGALGGEKSLGRDWRHSSRVAQGAAVGRAWSIVIKGIFAAAIGATLTVAAWV